MGKQDRHSLHGRGQVHAWRMRDGLRVEDAGGDLMVLDPDGDVVHRVTGAGADALRSLRDGPLSSSQAPEYAGAIDQLIDAGIITDDSDTDGIITDDRGPSRRKVMIAGGVAWTAATVTTFALANPAAAATGCPGGIVPSTTFQYTVPGKHYHTTGPLGSGTTQVLVRTWGAGGGGGGGSKAKGGGGGGGGAYAASEPKLTECTAYYLWVGKGGLGGLGLPEGKDGNPGGSSQFGLSPVHVLAAGGKGGLGTSFGGAGGLASASTGPYKWSGGKGGAGAVGGGGAGGGSAGSGGDGGPGTDFSGTTDVPGGTAGPGSPGGAAGGDGPYLAIGYDGHAPGGGAGGGAGGSTATSTFDGGVGADGAVWIGI